MELPFPERRGRADAPRHIMLIAQFIECRCDINRGDDLIVKDVKIALPRRIIRRAPFIRRCFRLDQAVAVHRTDPQIGPLGAYLKPPLRTIILSGDLAAIGLFVGLAFFISGFSMVIGAFEASEVPEVEYRRTTTIAGAKGGATKKEKEKKKEGVTEEDKEMKEREEKNH